MKFLFSLKMFSVSLLAALFLLLVGCGDTKEAEMASADGGEGATSSDAAVEEGASAESEGADSQGAEAAGMTDAGGAGARKRPWTEPELHEALYAKNPGYNGGGQFKIESGLVLVAALPGCNLSDISPLAGMPLLQLDLQNNPVRDLSPLKGAPLIGLYLDGTQVDDLSPLADAELEELYLNGARGVSSIAALKGQPLKVLNLFQTSVHDLSPLRGAPLESLWLNETPVADISPLAGAPLVTITLHRTQVSDLSPLAKCPTVQRIHAGETPVTDLSPLKDLNLTRLIFPPNSVKKGLDEIRKMQTLSELGVTLEQKMWPSDFWQAFDAGAFNTGKK